MKPFKGRLKLINENLAQIGSLIVQILIMQTPIQKRPIFFRSF